MIIGVPKEIKLQEHRIGLTPESVKALTDKKHEVLVQNNGGFEAVSESDGKKIYEFTGVGKQGYGTGRNQNSKGFSRINRFYHTPHYPGFKKKIKKQVCVCQHVLEIFLLKMIIKRTMIYINIIKIIIKKNIQIFQSFYQMEQEM